MNLSAEFLLQIVVSLAGAFGAYAAIKTDLARIGEQSKNAAQSASDAHARIDAILQRGN